MAPTKLASGSTAPKPSQKRNASELTSDSDSDAPVPPTKKAKGPTNSTKATTPSVTTSYTANDLKHLSHAELVAYVIDLQKQLNDSKKSSSTSSNAQELNPEELNKKVEHLRALVARQIKKAMVWKPSCKTGSATFSQDFVVQHPQVIKKLFRGSDNGKAWKMKKLSAEDFERVVGDIDASVMYDSLELTSDVTIRWDAENGGMKCSGKYGRRGTGVRNMKEATSIESD